MAGRVIIPARGGGRTPGIGPSMLKRMLELPPKPASVAEAVKSMKEAGVASESAGVVTVRNNFAWQSFFSSTLIEQALLTQNVAEPIVPSTLKTENTAGFGIALYPSSECPLAVQLLLGGGRSGSSTIVIKPGDAYVSQQRFDGIRYGLPFGWLGGGAVQLRILQERDDVLFLPASPEIVFHRIRLPVWAPGDNPAASGRGTSANWPRRFPWPNAIDQNANPQKGQPALGVTPTKTIFRLRKSTVTATSRVRLVLLKTDDLDLGSDGATLDAINASGSWIDIQFPQIAATGFQIGGTVITEFPAVTNVQDITCRLGGDSAIAVMIDADGTVGSTNGLANAVKCDIERYCTL